MTRAMNFNAGPATLPLPALERARDELLDFEGSGMSVMEHSHRGKLYDKVHHEALGLVAELLGVSRDTWDVLFLQGGASTLFAQIPMNFLPAGKTADFVLTGTWGEKAVAEAKSVQAIGGGTTNVAATTRNADKSYTRVTRPGEVVGTPGAAYLHLTSNETIHGIEYALGPDTPFPSTGAPVVVDMSSDIFGRQLDVAPFDLVFAGAQKNIGPSGVTLCAVKKSFTEQGRKDIPTVFQLRTVAANDSLYNTPPTFAIYLVRNVLQWLKEAGGVAAAEARNRAKAKTLYDAIDGSGGFYRGPVDVNARSIMNVVWRLPTESLEEAFVKEATAERMIGLKGHRATGGIRASIYNAAELSWCEALASFMKEFARKNG